MLCDNDNNLHRLVSLNLIDSGKALFSLSRFSSPVHPGLTNRGKPGRTVAAPWTTGANRGGSG